MRSYDLLTKSFNYHFKLAGAYAEADNYIEFNGMKSELVIVEAEV